MFRRSVPGSLVGVLTVLAGGCFGAAPAPVAGDETGPPDSDPWRSGKTPGEPSKAVYQTILREQLYVPSIDGTRLAAAVYRPEVPAGLRLPVILIITPYEAFVASQPTQVDAGLVPDGSPSYERELAPRGYAVVTANVRGTGNSDGCYDNRGTKEREDGYALVEHFASQPWSNGRVGMAGGSYLGSTQWTTAAMNPPHLVTIMPGSATVSVYRHLHVNGVKSGEGGNFASYTAIGAVPGADVGRSGWVEGRVADVRCPYVETMTHDFDATGDYTPFWAERDVEKDAANITAAVFLSHGFLDTTVRPDMTVPIFERLQSPKAAILGPWGHANPTMPPQPAETWYGFTTRWFDYWLKDIDTGVMDLPRVRSADQLGNWYAYDDWPPQTGTQNVRYYLSKPGAVATGRLSPTAPVGAEPPSEYMSALTPASATLQGQAYEIRFATERLTADTHFAGAPRVHLTTSTTAKDRSYWMVGLYDVSGETWTRTVVGYVNLRHRDGVEAPKAISPGEPYVVEFPLFPDDHVFPAGHQVGLIITGPGESAWPDPGEPVNTLYHDAKRVSYLELPARLEGPSR